MISQNSLPDIFMSSILNIIQDLRSKQSPKIELFAYLRVDVQKCSKCSWIYYLIPKEGLYFLFTFSCVGSMSIPQKIQKNFLDSNSTSSSLGGRHFCCKLFKRSIKEIDVALEPPSIFILHKERVESEMKYIKCNKLLDIPLELMVQGRNFTLKSVLLKHSTTTGHSLSLQRSFQSRRWMVSSVKSS